MLLWSGYYEREVFYDLGRKGGGVFSDPKYPKTCN